MNTVCPSRAFRKRFFGVKSIRCVDSETRCLLFRLMMASHAMVLLPKSATDGGPQSGNVNDAKPVIEANLGACQVMGLGDHVRGEVSIPSSSNMWVYCADVVALAVLAMAPPTNANT